MRKAMLSLALFSSLLLSLPVFAAEPPVHPVDRALAEVTKALIEVAKVQLQLSYIKHDHSDRPTVVGTLKNLKKLTNEAILDAREAGATNEQLLAAIKVGRGTIEKFASDGEYRIDGGLLLKSPIPTDITQYIDELESVVNINQNRLASTMVDSDGKSLVLKAVERGKLNVAIPLEEAIDQATTNAIDNPSALGLVVGLLTLAGAEHVSEVRDNTDLMSGVGISHSSFVTNNLVAFLARLGHARLSEGSPPPSAEQLMSNLALPNNTIVGRVLQKHHRALGDTRPEEVVNKIIVDRLAAARLIP